MRALVAGGGIGGLGIAGALRRGGHEVVVLEQAARLDHAGAGITLFANAMRALDSLGIGDAVRGQGSAARYSAIQTRDGRVLTTVPDELLEGAVAVHRGDLQAALLKAAGEVRVGAQVTGVEQTAEAAIAKLADGSVQAGDLLVGADGLRSRVRAAVAPSVLRYSGYTAWRGVSPVRIETGHLSESWGIGERFGLVDIGSQTYWFATANVAEGEVDDPDRRKAELMQRFARWHAPIGAVLDATPADAILRNDVFFLDPLRSWSAGRTVLLGDAAHATTPGVGQGAAQALEDAVALAHELAGAELAGAGALAAALERYEAGRRSRALLAVKLSRRADAAAQLGSPLGCRLRDALVSRIPERVQVRQLAPLIRQGP